MPESFASVTPGASGDPRQQGGGRGPAAALLLDLDGTLVDSEGFHREVFRSWFAARGWLVSDEVLAGFTGRRADDVLSSEPGPWAGEDVATMTAELLGHMGTLPRPALAAGAAELVAGGRRPAGAGDLGQRRVGAHLPGRPAGPVRGRRHQGRGGQRQAPSRALRPGQPRPRHRTVRLRRGGGCARGRGVRGRCRHRPRGGCDQHVHRRRGPGLSKPLPPTSW